MADPPFVVRASVATVLSKGSQGNSRVVGPALITFDGLVLEAFPATGWSSRWACDFLVEPQFEEVGGTRLVRISTVAGAKALKIEVQPWEEEAVLALARAVSAALAAR